MVFREGIFYLSYQIRPHGGTSSHFKVAQETEGVSSMAGDGKSFELGHRTNLWS